MGRIIRSATLQIRVTPGVKHASEEILYRIGLNMTEAIEIFLRRLIVDQKLPFEVIALNDETMKMIIATTNNKSRARKTLRAKARGDRKL